jgi:hypothetical protein
MKALSSSILCILFFVSSISPTQHLLCGQNHPCLPEGDCPLPSGDSKTEIPFTLSYTHILVPISINGSEPFQLILDTGMPMDGIILFDSKQVRDLELPLTGLAVAPGEEAEGEPNVAFDICLDLPGLKLEDQMVSIRPPLGKYGELEGVIGLSLFSRFVVDINHDRKIITLHEPKTYSYKGSGKKLPFTFNKYGIPEIPCKVTMQNQKKAELHLIVDTGAGHALSLNVGAHHDIQVPEKSIACSLGRTMYGEITGHVGRLQRFEVGGYVFNNVLTSFISGKEPYPVKVDEEGNLGNALLKRFNVVFDYSRKEMVLEPSNDYKKPFHFIMTGFQWKKTAEGEMIIDHLIASSPAAESGIMKGDQVMEINDRPVAQFSKEELVRLFTEEGKIIDLVIAREDKEWKVKLKLRPLI